MTRENTIQNLPENERPYEKCKNLGPASLSDTELLAVMLRNGSAGENAIDLSRRVLYDPVIAFREGLERLSSVHLNQWKDLHGIGPVKATQIVCMDELARRMARAKGSRGRTMREPSFVAENYMEDLRHLGQEIVKVVFLDTKAKYMGECDVSKGTVNMSLISPREIYSEALRFGAVFILVLHNHPSGDPTPSQADIDLTDRLIETGKMLGVPLLDHIVIGDHCYFSFEEHGYM